MIRDKLFEVCCDIVAQTPMSLDEIASIAQHATRLTRRFAHSVVKNYRQQFLGSDPCPCLSGQTVAACTDLRALTIGCVVPNNSGTPVDRWA